MRLGRFGYGSLGAALGAVLLAGVSAPALAAPNTGKVSFTLGNDFTTAYFFRGILQERNGFISQPYAEVDVNLFDDEEGPLSNLTLLAGTWNSVQSEKTLESGSGPGNWYESDAYAGLSLTFIKNLTFKPVYIAYTYPNGAFSTVQEFDFTLSFDDSEYLGMWALAPSATLAVEIDNTALGADEGKYLELNMKPTFTVYESDTYPVSLSIPLQLGLSLGNYYEDNAEADETFGFFKTGVVLGVPLAFIPEDYGSWSATAGVNVYAFGTNLTKFNQDDSPWVVGTWGLSMTY